MQGASPAHTNIPQHVLETTRAPQHHYNWQLNGPGGESSIINERRRGISRHQKLCQGVMGCPPWQERWRRGVQGPRPCTRHGSTHRPATLGRYTRLEHPQSPPAAPPSSPVGRMERQRSGGKPHNQSLEQKLLLRKKKGHLIPTGTHPLPHPRRKRR